MYIYNIYMYMNTSIYIYIERERVREIFRRGFRRPLDPR